MVKENVNLDFRLEKIAETGNYLLQEIIISKKIINRKV